MDRSETWATIQEAVERFNYGCASDNHGWWHGRAEMVSVTCENLDGYIVSVTREEAYPI